MALTKTASVAHLSISLSASYVCTQAMRVRATIKLGNDKIHFLCFSKAYKVDSSLVDFVHPQTLCLQLSDQRNPILLNFSNQTNRSIMKSILLFLSILSAAVGATAVPHPGPNPNPQLSGDDFCFNGKCPNPEDICLQGLCIPL